MCRGRRRRGRLGRRILGFDGFFCSFHTGDGSVEDCKFSHKGHGILFGVGDSGITTRFGGSGVTEWIRSSKTFCI